MTSSTMERKITLWVNGFTLVAVVLAGGIAWGTLSSKADQNKEDIEELEETIVKDSQKIQDIEVNSTETKVRLRAVERTTEQNSRKLDIILREIRRGIRDAQPSHQP